MYFRHVSFRPMIGRPLVIVKVLGELGGYSTRPSTQRLVKFYISDYLQKCYFAVVQLRLGLGGCHI